MSMRDEAKVLKLLCLCSSQATELISFFIRVINLEALFTFDYMIWFKYLFFFEQINGKNLI